MDSEQVQQNLSKLSIVSLTSGTLSSPLSEPFPPDLHASDYADNQFERKPEQMAEVTAFIKEKGFLPPELVETEVAWFYNNLGIDNMYFRLESIETIANHIMALYAAKLNSYLRNSHVLDVHLEQELHNEAIYIHTSKPGISQINGPQVEQRVDRNYLDVSTPECAFRLETYRSTGIVSSSFKTQLRCYFVAQCRFPMPADQLTEEDKQDITKVSDQIFLNKATPNTIEIYQRIMRAALNRTGPVIEMHEVENSRCKRLVIGYRQGSSQSFFSSLSDLYHYYGLYSSRKYVENFANGITIICLYLMPVDQHRTPSIETTILQVMKEASLMYCLPTTPLQAFFQSGILSVQETVYGYLGLVFAQHFLNRLGSEYSILAALLDQADPSHVDVLDRLKKRLRQETFTREYVLEIVKQYPDLIKVLYVHFATQHYVLNQRESLRPSLSFQRLQTDAPLSDTDLSEKIRKTVANPNERMVFEAFLTFNRHVLKTNFYQPTKVAISIRMDPTFLPEIEYPHRPFGLFLVVGSEFRGFHIRFRDIARGGIRIIKSRNREAYSMNLRSLFDENYALAATQQRKNKDIPEGGSKGTILLDVDKQDKAEVSFKKYIDAILDLLLVGTTPGIKEKIVDRYGKPEILFLGPDEGTADFMDWASRHARQRGASFWKAFTTGKSQNLGGIPHDLYGMTTTSIRAYVTGIYEELGLDEATITKFQTGGPDGDLGSNEIKMSKEKTLAIVDGSGVIYDPHGLSRSELFRLAQNRQTISHFDLSLLGPGGFRVLIEDRDVRLPSGEIVDDGLVFRNEFHLHELSSADIFVPCGGRPEAVTIHNVARLLSRDGTPRFRFIVEGANLFFTQEARIRLENAGVVIFKDASANKGGVTSSSLEVMAALIFTDDEFARCMQVNNGVVPDFYNRYVATVKAIISGNARLEFSSLWREHAKRGIPRSALSDELSQAIVQLGDELQESDAVWGNVQLRKLVLYEAIPLLLQELIGGIEAVIERLPESYLRALFGSYLASRFVYEHGIHTSQFAFYEYMAKYQTKLCQLQFTGNSV